MGLIEIDLTVNPVSDTFNYHFEKNDEFIHWYIPVLIKTGSDECNTNIIIHECIKCNYVTLRNNWDEHNHDVFNIKYNEKYFNSISNEMLADKMIEKGVVS